MWAEMKDKGTGFYLQIVGWGLAMVTNKEKHPGEKATNHFSVHIILKTYIAHESFALQTNCPHIISTESLPSNNRAVWDTVTSPDSSLMVEEGGMLLPVLFLFLKADFSPH